MKTAQHSLYLEVLMCVASSTHAFASAFAVMVAAHLNDDKAPQEIVEQAVKAIIELDDMGHISVLNSVGVTTAYMSWQFVDGYSEAEFDAHVQKVHGLYETIMDLALSDDDDEETEVAEADEAPVDAVDSLVQHAENIQFLNGCLDLSIN